MAAKKILIVDDEQIARQRLTRFLNETAAFQIQEAENGLAAIEKIEQFKPDIVFLDIQMPGLTGFDVLQQIESRTFQIIFQTAYDEYALQAFEESACDYLLKPFTKERFDKALNKALAMQGQQETLSLLESNLKKDQRFLNKVTFKQGGKLKILSIERVSSFVSQDHYTCAQTLEGIEHIVDFSIAYLVKHLNPDHFVRCHRNGIVAIEQIKSVGDTNQSQIELKNGGVLQLSRSNRTLVLQKLKLLTR